MGCARPLCYALNAARRRGEEGIEEWRPGANPFLWRGIRPVVPRFIHWERVQGCSNNVNMAHGRGRSFPAPPQAIIKRQAHSQPCCLMAGFGYVAPNTQFQPRINPPSHCAPNLPCPCQNHCPCHFPPPPPLPQNQTDTESTSSDSSDSEDGDSLVVNNGTP